MVYVVEIVNEQGQTATKEYEAKSEHHLFIKLTKDLQGYPDFSVLSYKEKVPQGRWVVTAFA